jgi:MerR family mercuric resistance operon transcriptional regulator
MPASEFPLAIGTVAKRTGCNIETIRFYERIGLIRVAERTRGGFRLYRSDHLRRLTLIRRLRGLAFTMDEVRTLLRTADASEKVGAHLRIILETYLDTVRSKIADLRTMERALTEIIAECAEGSLHGFPVIEALLGKTTMRRPTTTKTAAVRHRSVLPRGVPHVGQQSPRRGGRHSRTD